MPRYAFALLACLAAFVAVPVVADDFDDLVKKLDPPARFNDHKPQFTMEEKTITFIDHDGKVEVPHWFIKDGDRYVAFMPRTGFHGGCIYVIVFRPGQGPKTIEGIGLPSERWHIETTVGAQLRTNAWIPTASNSDPKTYKWDNKGDTLVLTRQFKGMGSFNEWTHRTPKGKEYYYDTTNTLTLSVDPKLGYVVDTYYETWTNEPIKRLEYASAAMSGRHSVWKDEQTCQRYAIMGPKGLYGYATNMASTLQHYDNSMCKPDGFVAFLDRHSGWSTTYTNQTGSLSKLVVCRPHTDHDFTMDLGAALKKTEGDKKFYVVRHRMLAMPPEVTKHVWDTMQVLHKGDSRVMLRIGQLEDMEAQPLPADGEERGVTFGGEITEKYARSGKKSLHFTGNVQNGIPTLCVKPNRRYVVEGWLKLDPLTEEQKKEAEQQQRDRIERAKSRAEKDKKRGKTPKPIPEFRPIGKGKAWLTVGFRLYDMDPVRKTFESEVIEVKDGWQRVRVEFDSPAWGPSILFRFTAQDCNAYLDDFRLEEIKDGKVAKKAG